MRKLVVALPLLVLACSRERGSQAFGPPSPPPVDVRANAEWASRRNRIQREAFPEIEIAVDDVMRKFNFPSMVAGLLVDGQLVWWRGYGRRDLEDGGAVDVHTVYRIASVTKTITAMALLMLRDEGKINLDTPAEQYVPELARVPQPTEDGGPITIRQLITHTSGLPRVGNFDYSNPREIGVTRRELLAAVEGIRLRAAPGTKHEYSNLGYALLGLIVEQVAGVPYHEFVNERILTPLGMRSARWRHEEVPGQQLATAYAYRGGAYEKVHHWNMGEALAMGGLYASLDDMARYLSFQMTVWPPGARPDKPPLRNASVRESHMLAGWQPAKNGTGIGWGVTAPMGWGPMVYHTGVTHAYVTDVLFVPERRYGVIVMSNCGRASEVGKVGKAIHRIQRCY